MTLAIIKTGGKQYKVKENDVLKIEKIEGDKDSEVVFDKVLLLEKDSKEIKIGHPFLENTIVKARILEQGRGKKIKIIKFKPKTRYKKTQGHRQFYTKIQIESIG